MNNSIRTLRTPSFRSTLSLYVHKYDTETRLRQMPRTLSSWLDFAHSDSSSKTSLQGFLDHYNHKFILTRVAITMGKKKLWTNVVDI